MLLKTDKNKEPDWFDIQYEKLPIFYFWLWEDGTHRVVFVPTLFLGLGKLPYNFVDDEKKKLQSFPNATSESLGSTSTAERSYQRCSGGDDMNRPRGGPLAEDEEGITSPLKNGTRTKDSVKEKEM